MSVFAFSHTRACMPDPCVNHSSTFHTLSKLASLEPALPTPETPVVSQTSLSGSQRHGKGVTPTAHPAHLSSKCLACMHACMHGSQAARPIMSSSCHVEKPRASYQAGMLPSDAEEIAQRQPLCPVGLSSTAWLHPIKRAMQSEVHDLLLHVQLGLHLEQAPTAFLCKGVEGGQALLGMGVAGTMQCTPRSCHALASFNACEGLPLAQPHHPLRKCREVRVHILQCPMEQV